jgi:tryptophanyl-tRNA synthetase
MHTLRSAVGLRSLADSTASTKAKASKSTQATFKQYKEGEGQFYFKLVDAKGLVLLQSKAFGSPKQAGVAIAQLRQLGAQALSSLAQNLEICNTVDNSQVVAVLNQMRDGA